MQIQMAKWRVSHGAQWMEPVDFKVSRRGACGVRTSV